MMNQVGERICQAMLKMKCKSCLPVPDYGKARFWFFPIVICFTLFFGVFAGIQGAIVGFFYGLAGGDFFSMKSARE